jgi:hypothetical protein
MIAPIAPLPPQKLDIYVDRNTGGGAAYMFDKMTDKGPIWNNILLGGNIPLNYCTGGSVWRRSLCGFLGLLAPLTSVVVTFMPDVFVGCGNLSNGSLKASDRIKETVYHECGHAAHYQNLPSINRNIWWIDNVNYIVHQGTTANPYGDGTHSGASKCAVIEMWGYHIGATIADAAYGMNSSPAYIQSGSGQARWRYNNAGKSSYWWALEDFDPNWPFDPTRWMPLGVLHDMMDERVDNIDLVDDNVAGYTQQKFFNALQSDVISIPLYKLRLLQQNNNNQQSNVDILFQSYNY